MTHWRKNLDGKYISGEDLKNSIKGLSPSMDVEVVSLADAETFDRNTQEKQIKSAIFLKEIGGKPLTKPCLLNVTNAKFFEKLTGTPEIEGWAGAQATIFAKTDNRHGHVVRFKKYIAPNLTDPKPAFAKIKGVKSVEDLKLVWGELTAQERNLPAVLAAKEAKKESFS